MEEIWLPVKDYEGYYEVSNLGRIKSLARIVINTGRILKEKYNALHLKRGGYHSVLLSKDTVKSTTSLHRLVANAFLPNPDNKKVVNHIDGNKLNNRVDNLEWTSHRENSCHYYRNINTGTPVGVFKRKKYNRYTAHAHVDGKKIFLGDYGTAEDAHKARVKYFESNNILNKYV
jgi:hypothetical protein